jgi:hypothetical protein
MAGIKDRDMSTQRIKSGMNSKKRKGIRERIKNWYKGWLNTNEPLYLFIWVMLIVLLWIKLFHTV